MTWVAGARGMLGQAVVHALRKAGEPFAESGREVDITDARAVEAFASTAFAAAAEGERWIVNCAAYTAVDKAEDEPDAAFAVNAKGAGNLAKAAVAAGAGLVHISTDYVFDGKASSPYTEEASVNPIGVYGRSKLEGERLVQAAFAQSPLSFYITRTSWLYGPGGKNFVYTMLNLMNARPEVRVVCDQRGTPTFTCDLAACILRITRSKAASGVYHYSGDGEATWFDFAQEIYRQGMQAGRIERECRVRPCTTAEYPTRAARPAYSVLSKAKIRRAINAKIPRWEESLKSFMEEL